MAILVRVDTGDDTSQGEQDLVAEIRVLRGHRRLRVFEVLNEVQGTSC